MEANRTASSALEASIFRAAEEGARANLASATRDRARAVRGNARRVRAFARKTACILNSKAIRFKAAAKTIYSGTANAGTLSPTAIA